LDYNLIIFYILNVIGGGTEREDGV
jgi:hypothetical protein